MTQIRTDLRCFYRVLIFNGLLSTRIPPDIQTGSKGSS